MKILILDVDPSSPTFLGLAIDPRLSAADTISALTLIVSLLTLAVAVWASLKLMRDWRKQRQLDRRAEVATEALVAVAQMSNFLQGMLRGSEVSETRRKPGRDRVRTFHRRWSASNELERDFLLAEVKAEVVLGDDALRVMRSVWGVKSHIWSRQWTYAIEQDQSDGLNKSGYNAAFGAHLPDKILKARNDARDLFVPIARLDNPGWFAKLFRRKPKSVRHDEMMLELDPDAI